MIQFLTMYLIKNHVNKGDSGVTPSSIYRNHSWKCSKMDARDQNQVGYMQDKYIYHCTISLASHISIKAIANASFASCLIRESLK